MTLLKEVMAAARTEPPATTSIELHPEDWEQMVADVTANAPGKPLNAPPPRQLPDVPAEDIAGLIGGVAVVLRPDVERGTYRMRGDGKHG